MTGTANHDGHDGWTKWLRLIGCRVSPGGQYESVTKVEGLLRKDVERFLVINDRIEPIFQSDVAGILRGENYP